VAHEPDTEITAAVARERQDLAVLLAELPADRWDAPTLRAGWRTPLGGAAQDLALVMVGRRLPAGRLRGQASGRFTAR
jgi:hypothetical protein